MFQGNNVKDQDANVAVFQDMTSSASLMVAGKFSDVIASRDGHPGSQSDAPMAYAQTELGGDETWIFLPRDQWPAAWHGMRNPVCRLRLALYGHPLSGAFWEQHCRKMLLSVGFESIPSWECCFLHRELKIVLSVCVDDSRWRGRRRQ